MHTNKRFNLGNDNHIRQNGIILSDEKTIDLLNSLSDENEQLKSLNHELRNELEFDAKQYKVVSDNLGEYSIVREDNTIVVTEMQDKTTAELICDELNEIVGDFNSAICTVSKSKIDNLEKENLQLKEDLGYYKAKCGSLEEGLFKSDREISKLKSQIIYLVENALKELFDEKYRIIEDISD